MPLGGREFAPAITPQTCKRRSEREGVRSPCTSGVSPMPSASPDESTWPALSYADGCETWATLHLWSQVVGKVRLALTPWLNHSWQTPLYLTPRGLTTGLIPYGARGLDLEF